jgi:hypothetical protein
MCAQVPPFYVCADSLTVRGIFWVRTGIIRAHNPTFSTRLLLEGSSINPKTRKKVMTLFKVIDPFKASTVLRDTGGSELHFFRWRICDCTSNIKLVNIRSLEVCNNVLGQDFKLPPCVDCGLQQGKFCWLWHHGGHT